MQLVNWKVLLTIFDDCFDPENYMSECFDEIEIIMMNFLVSEKLAPLNIFERQSKHSFYNANL